MPTNVATIGSVVRYRIGDGPVERRALSLPEASRPNGQFINILTPVGLALLGRRAGATFAVALPDGGQLGHQQIGRESCRGRVDKYVRISLVGGALKKKKI